MLIAIVSHFGTPRSPKVLPPLSGSKESFMTRVHHSEEAFDSIEPEELHVFRQQNQVCDELS